MSFRYSQAKNVNGEIMKIKLTEKQFKESKCYRCDLSKMADKGHCFCLVPRCVKVNKWIKENNY